MLRLLYTQMHVLPFNILFGLAPISLARTSSAKSSGKKCIEQTTVFEQVFQFFRDILLIHDFLKWVGHAGIRWYEYCLLIELLLLHPNTQHCVIMDILLIHDFLKWVGRAGIWWYEYYLLIKLLLLHPKTQHCVTMSAYKTAHVVWEELFRCSDVKGLRTLVIGWAHCCK